MLTLSSARVRQTKVVTPFGVVAVSVAASAWTLRSDWETRPLYASCFTLGVAMFVVGYLWWCGYWRLVDSVVETPAGLRVCRGRYDLLITFREVSVVGHRVLHGQSVCLLDLHSPGPLGSTIEFLPISDAESLNLIGIDLWEHLERMVASAQPRRAT